MPDWRRARFSGQAKTHLQHIGIALGMNILRVGAWLKENFKAHTTQKGAFVALAPAAA